MKEIYDIIQELRANNSSNYKIEVLEKHKGNYNLQRFLQYVYDSKVNYWLTKLPESELFRHYTNDLTPSDFYPILDRLKNRDITGNEAKKALSDHLSFCGSMMFELYDLVISRDIKSGISVKGINKVFPNLIKETPYMRCSKESDVDIDKLLDKHGFLYIQKKSDGIFSYIIKQDDKVKLLTRAGSQWQSNILTEDLQYLPNDIVLVGEALIKDGERELSRQQGNGLINSFIKRYATIDSLQEKIDKASEKARTKLIDKLDDNIGEWTFTENDLHFEVWDILTLEEFEQRESKRPYSKRLSELEYMIPKINSEKVSVIETEKCYSKEDTDNFITRMYAEGNEGGVVKTPTLLFQNKTSKEQIKIKAELDCDLLCVGIEQGTGKYTGKIGSLICQSSCGNLVVNVGTGLTDKDREKSPDKYVGKIIAVKYNEKIERKESDTWSLFLPVLLETRLDKTEADSLEEIE